MSEHTPGPWGWYWRHEDGEAICGVFSETRPGMAYSVCRAPRYQTKEQWEADARLIAAAPELLEALKETVCALEVCGKDFRATEVARAVIAKATTAGETP